MYSNEDYPDLIDKEKRSQYDRTIARLADGSRFAEYTIIKLLGRGGMGAVYEARHEILEKHFAIKALPYEFMTRKDAVERFRTEARVMANLRHPNIVQVDDFRETNGLYWLRMELARGDGDGVRSLQELAKKTDGIIEQKLLLTLMLDVLKGIAYGHQKGLVHRDLKPANILLFPKQDSGLTAKVSDYGLVKMFGEEFLRSRVTQSVQLSLAGAGPGSIGDEATKGNQQGGTSTRALLGTWEYMSPEQKRGEEATPASDVYSLGLICYQLLTGEDLSLQLPSQINPKIIPEWNDILLKALQSRQENRFNDAGEMLQALEIVRQAIQELTEQKQREKIEAEIREIRQKAATAVQDGDLNGALKMLTEVGEKYPDQKQLLDDMSAIRKQIEEQEAAQKRYQNSLEQAEQLISANQLDEALELFANPYHQKEVTVDLGSGVWLAMAYLQGGSFQMGSPVSESGRWDDEGPVHRVELDGFWMGKYQVTQAQYHAIMGKNPSRFKDDNRPVERVSWKKAMKFCQKLSQKTGKTFTLPTEAQWEYACRAGTRTQYCFGDDSSLLSEYAWYGKNSNGETHPVGRKKPNAWGLYDMHGNVYEWCLDWDDVDYYRQSPKRNPVGPSFGSYRVCRGGGWYYSPGHCRSANRNRGSPGHRSTNLGFRLAAP